KKLRSSSLTSRRPIPKRGQIMVRIAATAYHTVVSVFSKPPRTTTPMAKTFLREMKMNRSN
ncbi:unnamed protein product, partial [Lactuca virosa]